MAKTKLLRRGEKPLMVKLTTCFLRFSSIFDVGLRKKEGKTILSRIIVTAAVARFLRAHLSSLGGSRAFDFSFMLALSLIIRFLSVVG